MINSTAENTCNSKKKKSNAMLLCDTLFCIQGSNPMANQSNTSLY